MLVINEKVTSVLGSADKPIENKMAWLSRSEGKVIIAVGGRSNRLSQEALPSETFLMDLIRASIDNPKLAEKLWSPFLAYVDGKANRGFFYGLKNAFLGIPTKLAIADAPTFKTVASIVYEGRWSESNG